MSTDQIIWWRLLIEEFGPTFEHIKGEKNVIADALSWLDANFNEKLPANPLNDNMAYIFMTKEDIHETDFPLSPTLIAKCQRMDKELRKRSMSNANQNFITKKVEGVEVRELWDLPSIKLPFNGLNPLFSGFSLKKTLPKLMNLARVGLKQGTVQWCAGYCLFIETLILDYDVFVGVFLLPNHIGQRGSLVLNYDVFVGFSFSQTT